MRLVRLREAENEAGEAGNETAWQTISQGAVASSQNKCRRSV